MTTPPADWPARAREWWFLRRYGLARFCVHLGINILPAGRVREEIYWLLFDWSQNVREQIRKQRTTSPQRENHGR